MPHILTVDVTAELTGPPDPDGWTRSASLPTFCLSSRYLGIVRIRDAASVAASVALSGREHGWIAHLTLWADSTSETLFVRAGVDRFGRVVMHSVRPSRTRVGA